MTGWEKPEWTYVYNLLASNGVRAVTGAERPIRYVTAREVLRARIVTTAAAAHDLLAEMDATGWLNHGDVVPPGGGKTVRLYVLPNGTSLWIKKTIVT